MDMGQNWSQWRMWFDAWHYAVLSCMPETMTMTNVAHWRPKQQAAARVNATGNKHGVDDALWQYSAPGCINVESALVTRKWVHTAALPVSQGDKVSRSLLSPIYD